MNHIERLQTLAYCINKLVDSHPNIVIELIPSIYHCGDFYTIKARDGKKFSYTTEIQLFFSALEINFGLVRKYVRKFTSINHIYPNKSKTGYIFRK